MFCMVVQPMLDSNGEEVLQEGLPVSHQSCRWTLSRSHNLPTWAGQSANFIISYNTTHSAFQIWLFRWRKVRLWIRPLTAVSKNLISLAPTLTTCRALQTTTEEGGSLTEMHARQTLRKTKMLPVQLWKMVSKSFLLDAQPWLTRRTTKGSSCAFPMLRTEARGSAEETSIVDFLSSASLGILAPEVIAQDLLNNSADGVVFSSE